MTLQTEDIPAQEAAATPLEALTREHRTAIMLLCKGRTNAEASRRIGCSERTLYRWQADPLFKTALDKARAESPLLDTEAVPVPTPGMIRERLEELSMEAVERMGDIMREAKSDKDALAACKEILALSIPNKGQPTGGRSFEFNAETIQFALMVEAESREMRMLPMPGDTKPTGGN